MTDPEFAAKRTARATVLLGPFETLGRRIAANIRIGFRASCHPSPPPPSADDRARQAAECFLSDCNPERFFTHAGAPYQWGQYEFPLPEAPALLHPIQSITVVVDQMPIGYIMNMHLAGHSFVVGQLSTEGSCQRMRLGTTLIRVLAKAVWREYRHLDIDTLIIDDHDQGQGELCRHLGGEAVPSCMASRNGQRPAWRFRLSDAGPGQWRRPDPLA